MLIIGGGVAGLSVAAALAPHASVTVLEAEESIGYHSSGRSATMVHYALGNSLVRSLTLASRPFFEQPPEGFSEAPLGRTMPVLVHAREDELGALDGIPHADRGRVGGIETMIATDHAPHLILRLFPAL